MSSVRWNRRQWLVAGAGTLALAGVLFGAGFATAQALEGSESDTSDEGEFVATTGAVNGNGGRDIGMSGATAPSYPGVNMPATDGDQQGAIPAKATAEDAASSYGRGSSGGSQLYYPGPGFPQNGYCAAALPDVVSGSTIDLGGVVDLTLLGEGFVLRGITVRGEGECDDEGGAIDPYTVVDSTWQHSETGFEAFVTQRPASEQQPNVVTPYNGQVWAGGSVYTVWVNAYPVYPMKDPARSAMPGPDERGEEVIAEALAQLAPSVGAECYYRQTAGSWDDLAALGIGDPRPAIPGDLVEQYSDFQVFTAPPASCDAAELTGAGSFNASFAESADGSGKTYVSVGAWAQPAGSYAGLGYMDEGSAYWTNNGFSFNVSGYGENGPLGRDVIEAIARAMDSDFANACFISTRQLNVSELPGLGFNAATPPEGYEIVNSWLSASEAPGCAAGTPDADYYPQYSFNWSFRNGDGVQIEAGAYRYGGANEPQPGYIYEHGMNWSGSDGTQYSVYSYSNDGSGSGADRETLIQVALSMDPDLDVDALEEGPDAIPYAEDKPIR
jgi:hypothetical protein